MIWKRWLYALKIFKLKTPSFFYFESNYSDIVIVLIAHFYWKCYPSSVSYEEFWNKPNFRTTGGSIVKSKEIVSYSPAMLYYVMLCYVLFCYVMLYYVILYYVMLRSVMLCYVRLYYLILCYVMLCYVVSQFHDLEKMTICFENFKAQITFLFLILNQITRIL